MKTAFRPSLRPSRLLASLACAWLVLAPSPAPSAPASVLFQDDFTGGIPGWTAVQPVGGAYIEGPMIWEFNKVDNSFSEQSNIYTDSSASSPTRVSVMLINDTVAPNTFTYRASLTAGDDDGFGLIFGYQNESTFYRVAFARQNRTAGWPFVGWTVDRVNDRQITDLYGPYTTNYNMQWINTAGQRFDVLIAVTNTQFWLKVVDDAGGPGEFAWDLLTDVPLPGLAGGKVGMFSWGMSGTVGGVRSFKIQNPVLAPTPLTGDPAASVLTNWSFLITPRADGTTTLNTGGPMIWAQGLSIGGDRGTMIENSDNFHGPDNVAAGTTNFAAPSAVAGDVNWTNYVYSARFISSDNDGFGMLLRYQNETNFYRIAFRNQASTAGIKQGVSIQKNVNLSFSQVAASTTFIPPIYTPMDAHASIRGNRLQLLIVSNPLSTAPQVYFFGPYDIADPVLDSGKIGVFSWAQFQNVGGDASSDAGTEVDSVAVRYVAGEGLLVVSPFGAPDPPVGLNDLPANGEVTASVSSPVQDLPGTRRIVTGWQGGGSAPSNGTTNTVTFNLALFSSLQWNWRTEYELNVSATPGGTVSFLGTQWVREGTNVSLTATANPGYLFQGWAGSLLSPNPAATFSMTRPITLLARFAADSDGDQMPDDWEIQYFGNLAQDATGDPDGDGANNLAEYQAGTNPTSPEALIFTDGLVSQWINEARDRAVPGRLVVTNFGPGFRGVWEASNQHRYANDTGFIGPPFITSTNFPTNAAFQGPIILVRSNLWNPAWESNFTASAEFSVGDDDGVCFYFRYRNESNWCRVTVCGQTQAGGGSPLQGVTLQTRTNGYFTLVTPTEDSGAYFYTYPDDYLGFKRIRVTVTASNETFEVRVIGWDVLGMFPPDWNPGWERVLKFSEPSLFTGRVGVGCWGMGAFGAWNATADNPVGAGFFADNIIVNVGGSNVFVEDWETARLHTDFPAGWENAYPAAPPNTIGGDWHVTAHGTLANLANTYGGAQTGSTTDPKTDADGPILLAPSLPSANYVLELGIHPLDDGGMGFVYDFADTNNFSRVLFNSQAPGAGQLAQGLNVSRRSGGVWTDIVAGERSFIYTPGRHFDVRFAHNNGVNTLSAWNTDAPGGVYRWQWTGQPATGATRYGLAIWNMPDAHYTCVRARSLPTLPEPPFAITRISVVGGNVLLDISKPAWAGYHVQRAPSAAGPYENVALNQSASQYTEPLPANTAFYRLVRVP